MSYSTFSFDFSSESSNPLPSPTSTRLTSPSSPPTTQTSTPKAPPLTSQTNPSTTARATTTNIPTSSRTSTASDDGSTPGIPAATTTHPAETQTTTAPNLILSAETSGTPSSFSLPTSLDPTSSAPPGPGSSNTFLQNTGAVAGVFALLGLLVLGAILAIFFFIVRPRRARRLQRMLASEALAVPTGPGPFRDDSDGDYSSGPGFAEVIVGYQGHGDRYSATPSTNSDGLRTPYSDISSHGTYGQPPLSPFDGYGSSGLVTNDIPSLNDSRGYASAATGLGVGAGAVYKESLLNPNTIHDTTRYQGAYSVQNTFDNSTRTTSSLRLYQQPHEIPVPVNRGYQDSLYPPSTYDAPTLPVYPDTIRSCSPPAYSELSRNRSSATRAEATRSYSVRRQETGVSSIISGATEWYGSSHTHGGALVSTFPGNTFGNTLNWAGGEGQSLQNSEGTNAFLGGNSPRSEERTRGER